MQENKNLLKHPLTKYSYLEMKNMINGKMTLINILLAKKNFKEKLTHMLKLQMKL